VITVGVVFNAIVCVVFLRKEGDAGLVGSLALTALSALARSVLRGYIDKLSTTICILQPFDGGIPT
jgi:hypothetical protein